MKRWKILLAGPITCFLLAHIGTIALWIFFRPLRSSVLRCFRKRTFIACLAIGCPTVWFQKLMFGSSGYPSWIWFRLPQDWAYGWRDKLTLCFGLSFRRWSLCLVGPSVSCTNKLFDNAACVSRILPFSRRLVHFLSRGGRYMKTHWSAKSFGSVSKFKLSYFCIALGLYMMACGLVSAVRQAYVKVLVWQFWDLYCHECCLLVRLVCRPLSVLVGVEIISD